MIVQVGKLIIERIENLPFIDKYAGVVKVLSLMQKDQTGKMVKKMFPADCQTTLQQCESGRYKDLLPDSSKKSVLYLEEAGPAQVLRSEGGLNFWRANYNLVCWLNMPKLGFSDCSYSSVAINGILSKIPVTPFKKGIYQRVSIRVLAQRPKSENAFAKYAEESTLQYLMFPFDHFTLQVQVDFAVNKDCLTAMPINEPLNCLKK